MNHTIKAAYRYWLRGWALHPYVIAIRALKDDQQILKITRASVGAAALCAALAILLVLVGCGGPPAHVTKQDCKTQYTAWQTGPARPVALGLVDKLNNMDFKGAVPGAQKLESMPMPTCADPHGYWNQLLARVVAIGNNSDTGLGYIMMQAQEISTLSDKLHAELKHNAGVTT